MPLDASIISNQKDFQMDTMAETQAKRYALQQAQNQQDEYAYKLKKQQQTDADSETEKSIFHSSIETGADGQPTLNKQKFITGMMQHNPEKGMLYQQKFAEQENNVAKLKNENEKSGFDLRDKKTEYYQNQLPAVTPQNYKSFIAAARKDNIDFAINAPEEYDPNYVKQSMMTRANYLDAQKPTEYNGTVNYDQNNKAFVLDKNGVPKYIGTSKAPEKANLPTGYEANPAGGLMPITGGPADKTTSLKQIPATVNKAMLDNKQSLSKLDQAIALLEGNDVTNGDIKMRGDKEATGWKGYLPNGLLNRIDSKGVDARAAVTDIGSLLLHDRSGAAVTASETPRLLPFIPLATDDNATALKKLKRLKYEAGLENDLLSSQYNQDTGYKVGNDAPADNRGNQTPNNGNIIPRDQKIPSNAYQSKAPPIQFPKARRAPDGFWYVKDASGKYQKVVQ